MMRCTTSLVVLQALGMVAVTSGVACSMQVRARGAAGPQWIRDAALVGGVVLCAGGFAVFAPAESDHGYRVLWTMLATAVAMIAVLLWSRYLYACGFVTHVIFIVVAVCCGLPPMVGAFYLSSRGEIVGAGQVIAQISPIPMANAIWSDPMRPQITSLAIQVCIAALGGLLLWRRAQRGLNPMLQPS